MELSLDVNVIRGEILARTPETARLLEDGREALQKGNPESAERLFGECVSKLPEDRKEFAEAERTIALFQKQYAGGDWTHLPVGSDLAWLRHDGSWTWNGTTGRISARAESSRARRLFRGNLGDSFEVRGKFAFPATTGPNTGFGVIVGHAPFSAPRRAIYWFSARVYGRGTERSRVGWSELFYDLQSTRGESVRCELKKENSFILRRKGRMIDFSINDDPVLEKFNAPDRLRSGEGAFGFGFWAGADAPPCEIWDCEARPLRAEKGKSF
jgi:hypothetical protein